MSWDVELAKLFKARENKAPIGAIIGQVISIEPLKVSIFQGKAMLENAYRCSGCIVNVGDSVLCIADDTGQIFFIIDKVVKGCFLNINHK